MPRGDGTGPRGQGPGTGRGLGQGQGGGRGEEAVLRQDLMGTVFAQTAVKECPTNYEFPAISRNALNAGWL